MTNLTKISAFLYKNQNDEIIFNLPKVSRDVFVINILDSQLYPYLKVNRTNLIIDSTQYVEWIGNCKEKIYLDEELIETIIHTV